MTTVVIVRELENSIERAVVPAPGRQVEMAHLPFDRHVGSPVPPGRRPLQTLHNQTALLIKGALLFRKGVVVVDVPFHLKQ